MELQAAPEGPASATVVEARLERGAGALATVVVKVWTHDLYLNIKHFHVWLCPNRRGFV